MLRITKDKIHHFMADVENDMTFADYVKVCVEPLLTEQDFKDFEVLDLKPILADAEMSENHVGGDDMINLVDGVLAAQKAGYDIATWYGPKSEALVVGYRREQVQPIDP